MSADLFAPCQLSDLTLANQYVMAPMTRKVPRRRGRHGAADDGGPLPRSRRRGPDHHRVHPGLAAGHRLPVHARDLHQPAGRELGAAHQRRSLGRRAHLRPAAALRPDLPPQPPAGPGSAGRPVGAPPRRAGSHLRGHAGLHHPAPAGNQRDPRSRRPVPPRRGDGQAGGLRRRRGARGERLPHRPVPSRRLEPQDRQVRRQRAEPHALPQRGAGTRSPAPGRPGASACASPPRTASTPWRTPARKPTSATSSGNCGPAAWPTPT